MGESAAEGPSPATVAGAFTNVYYRVAEQQPHRLAELYGVDSQLSHAPGTVATGLADIGAAVLSLPLSKEHRARVTSIDAMRTGKGGYIVLVTGSLGSAMFAQTFLLDPTGDNDSRKHFYCRNDVFRFVTPSAGKLSTPADVLLPEHAEPVHVNATSAPGCDASPDGSDGVKESAAKASSFQGSLTSGGQVVPSSGDLENEDEDGDDDEDEEDDDDADADDNDEGEGDDEEGAPAEDQVHAKIERGAITTEVCQGEASGETKPFEEASSISNVAEPDAAQKSPSVGEQRPSGPGDEKVGARSSAQDAVKLEPEPAPSKPAAPKSWASIVSSSTAILAPAVPTSPPQIGSIMASTAPVATDGIDVFPANVTNLATSPMIAHPNVGAGPHVSTLIQTSGDDPEVATENKVAGIGSRSSARVSGSGNISGSVPGGWSSVENKRHSYQSENNAGFKVVGRPATDGHSHLNGHAHGPQNVAGTFHKTPAVHRVYGPSAVIQLGNLPSERMRDWRALVDDFSKEFAGYGHEIRNVDVKTYKGLAFVEYDSVDGVRAAVNAWADGPRDSGPFQGIALAVSEKRQQRRPILGGDRGGGVSGRGMMRGGGRGAGSRGRGRGAPFAGSPAPSQPASHPVTSQTAAST
jgi:hypothetical protein